MNSRPSEDERFALAATTTQALWREKKSMPRGEARRFGSGVKRATSRHIFATRKGAGKNGGKRGKGKGGLRKDTMICLLEENFGGTLMKPPTLARKTKEGGPDKN